MKRSVNNFRWEASLVFQLPGGVLALGLTGGHGEESHRFRSLLPGHHLVYPETWHLPLSTFTDLWTHAIQKVSAIHLGRLRDNYGDILHQGSS
jgi:hypothetical protein